MHVAAAVLVQVATYEGQLGQQNHESKQVYKK